MKEFLMLIREEANYGELSAEEMQACIEKHYHWVEELKKKGQYKEAQPLDAGGAYIKGRKKIVSDGPFLEGKECVSGYYILLATSLEEAVEIAKGNPDLDWDRTVEVREIMPMDEQ
ncbi:YciI family protein [Parapedobacter koreensis]|uniref:Uncharacterized conserved protein n=1 Tax=Parapedobacter koreensis TaxID=332977 RepID=A0A1H7JB97_9SPHI|nr:YciI family protein [Parapedobacter koreensis]SEK71796.1 Uncharacterized conserved protein [Parapedobacter koreensis]